ARLEQPRDHPDRRRLAGAVGAEEAVDFARHDVEADIVDRREGSVALDQVFYGNHLARDVGLDQQVMPVRTGMTSGSGPASIEPRPTRIGVELGASSRSMMFIFKWPISGRIAAWRSRPPRVIRTWVASAGNWLNVGS